MKEVSVIEGSHGDLSAAFIAHGAAGTLTAQIIISELVRPRCGHKLSTSALTSDERTRLLHGLPVALQIFPDRSVCICICVYVCICFAIPSHALTNPHTSSHILTIRHSPPHTLPMTPSHPPPHNHTDTLSWYRGLHRRNTRAISMKWRLRTGCSGWGATSRCGRDEGRRGRGHV